MTKVRAGYACLNLSLENSFKTFRLKTVEDKDEEKITQVMWHNMHLFKEIILDNIQNNIYVYRLSSDLIPFCTHPYMKALYKEKVEQNDDEVFLFRDRYPFTGCVRRHPAACTCAEGAKDQSQCNTFAGYGVTM